jgi:glycosyltransferase involved in cell wall biosynthesis
MDFSVICPVMDAEPGLLRAAAASVLGDIDAAGLRGEFIIVDDASSQTGTLGAITALTRGDARVRLCRLGANAGPATARNHGLAAARGEWVGFIDADDLWLPGRLAATQPLRTRPDIGWIGGRHRLALPDGSRPAPSLAEAMGQAAPCTLGGAALTRCLLANFWMHLGAMLVRRKLALQAGGFASGLFYGEDMLLMARLSILAPLHMFDADVYAWRRAGGGLTAAPARLTARSLAMYGAAASDRLLDGFRRELRWARYSALKGLAANNLRAGRDAAALGFALRAFLLDPREGRDLARFMWLWADGRGGEQYSRAEAFVMKDTP